MSIFRDRYVLNYRTITPDEVEGITIDRRTSEVYFNLIDDEVCEVENMIRLDLATGMKDSTGKEIFEKDLVEYKGMIGRIIQDEYGIWTWLSIDEEAMIPRYSLFDIAHDLTIAGMVPWEETNA